MIEMQHADLVVSIKPQIFVTTSYSKLMFKEGLHDWKSTNGTHGNLGEDKIVDWLGFRINLRKFNFKYISRKRFVSINKCRNQRREKLIGKH